MKKPESSLRVSAISGCISGNLQQTDNKLKDGYTQTNDMKCFAVFIVACVSRDLFFGS
jgi:hypothetical protein